MDKPLVSGDRETVHLFAVDLDEDALWPFVTPDPETGAWPLRTAMGVDVLDESQVEAAVIEDLVGIGLVGFLTEGIGVDADLIAPDRALIADLTGSVVIIRGAAFDGAHVPLHPRLPLRHVGSWHLTPAPSTMVPLTAETAKGVLSAPAPDAPARRTRAGWWILAATVALLAIGLLIGALA